MDMHSLWLVLSSVFFGVAGVYSFMHPDAALEALGLYIGFLLLLGGISQILRFFGTEEGKRSRWQMVIAVVDTLFGLWLIASGAYMVLAALLPFMMAGYILARGILLFVYYKRAKATVSHPAMYLAAAAGQVILGIAMTFMPLFAAKVFIYAVGFALLWSGFTCFTAWRDIQ